MQNEKMPEQESVEPISVLLLPSLALLLAEGIAQAEAKAPRLRAQQRGRVAKGKKGRLERFLRHLWGKTIPYPANSQRIEVCRPSRGSYFASQMDRRTQARRSKRQRKSRGAVPQMSPTQKAR